MKPDAMGRCAARAEQILVYGLPATPEVKAYMHDVVDVVNELRRARERLAELGEEPQAREQPRAHYLTDELYLGGFCTNCGRPTRRHDGDVTSCAECESGPGAIETLTEDDRLNIECMAGCDGEFSRKALRIIGQQAKRIAELTLERYAHRSVADNLKAACAVLRGDNEAAEKRIAELEAQLPQEMQHCSIRFIECPVGHGRLTATNWVDSGCYVCRIAELELTMSLARGALSGSSRPETVAAAVSEFERVLSKG